MGDIRDPQEAERLRGKDPDAYLPKYYGTGHQSNDNYISMISGQAPNIENQGDRALFSDFSSGTLGAYCQAGGVGCVYPAGVPTIASQLTAKGMMWRDYNGSMGADPAREASECGHPGLGMIDNTQKATAADGYATRHDPFVYFHSVIDDTTLCDSHVVNLALLPGDLTSAGHTPNYVFITPDLCNDGHDSPCANGAPGGLRQADGFLREWVPRITGSPAFRNQNGLLIVTFDESTSSDTSSCCGEIAGPGSPLHGITGSGGGDVGAVLLSPCIAPGIVSDTPYNHYTMLRSVEDIFGLAHIGYAQLPGERSFGADVFTRGCGPPPAVSVHVRALDSSASHPQRLKIRWRARGGATAVFFTIQGRTSNSGWRTLLRRTKRHSLIFTVGAARTYRFGVRSVEASGSYGAWTYAKAHVRGH